MKIYPVNTFYQTKSISNYKKIQPHVFRENVIQQDYVSFSGWFSRKSDKAKSVKQSDDIDNNDSCSKNPYAGKDEEFQNVTLDSLKGLNANGILLSLKIGDTLHRLDDESLIAIGDMDGAFFKYNVQHALTKENNFLPNPKNIKYVYVIHEENATNTFLIARMDKNNFYTYGQSRNLSNNERKDSYCWSTHNIPAKYNDLIETADKNRFRLLKTDKETNLIYYDAKFPVESFFTDGFKLENGFIIRKPSEKTEQLSGTNVNNQGSVLIDALKNKSKLDTKSINIPYRTFDDIAGMDDTIELVKKKVLFPLLYPEAFPGLMNRGTILYGAPGTGKTLLALAVIGEAKKRKGEDIHFIKMYQDKLIPSTFEDKDYYKMIEVVASEFYGSSRCKFDPVVSYEYFFGTLLSSYLLTRKDKDTTKKILELNEKLANGISYSGAFKILDIDINSIKDSEYIESVNQYYGASISTLNDSKQQQESSFKSI